MYLTDHSIDKIHLAAVCLGCSFSEGAIRSILAKHDTEIRLAATYYNESNLEKYCVEIIQNYMKVKPGKPMLVRTDSESKMIWIDRILGDVVYSKNAEYGIEMLNV